MSSTEVLVRTPDGEPRPFVQVSYECLGNKIEPITDKFLYGSKYGRFTVECKESFSLKVKSPGFQVFEKIFEEHGDTIVIVLSPLVSKSLDPVTFTAQIDPILLDKSLIHVDVIDIEEINGSGAQNIGELLGRQPGINLTEDRFLGAGIEILGLSGENVKILIDGMPMIGRNNGNIDLSSINLENVQRVEVVKGPLSVNYGSNALAGTINIITVNGLIDSNKTAVHTLYETNGKYNVSTHFNRRYGEGSFVLNAGRHFFSGFDFNDSSRSVDWKPRELYFGGFSYMRKVRGSTFRWTFDGSYELLTDRGDLRAPFYETAFDRIFKTGRVNQAIWYSRHIKRNYFIGINAAYNTYNRVNTTFFRDLTTLDWIPVTHAQAVDSNRFTIFHSRGFIKRRESKYPISFELGYDYNRETARGQRLLGDVKSIVDFAGYLFFEYRYKEKFTLSPGVRKAYNSSTETPWIPMLRYKWHWRKHMGIMGGYGRGFRVPGLKELYLDFVDVNHDIVGNDKLQPETSLHLNSGFFKTQKGKKGLYRGEMMFYFNQIEDRIQLINTGGNSYTYVNFASYRAIASELIISYLSEKFRGRIYTTANLKSDNPTELGFDSTHLNYQAGMNLYWLKLYQGIGLNLGLKFQSKDQFYTMSPEDGYQKLELASYFLADLMLTKEYKGTRMSLGVKNILNVRNLEILNGQSSIHGSVSGVNPLSTGRTFMITLKHRVGDGK